MLAVAGQKSHRRQRRASLSGDAADVDCRRFVDNSCACSRQLISLKQQLVELHNRLVNVERRFQRNDVDTNDVDTNDVEQRRTVASSCASIDISGLSAAQLKEKDWEKEREKEEENEEEDEVSLVNRALCDSPTDEGEELEAWKPRALKPSCHGNSNTIAQCVIQPGNSEGRNEWIMTLNESTDSETPENNNGQLNVADASLATRSLTGAACVVRNSSADEASAISDCSGNRPNICLRIPEFSASDAVNCARKQKLGHSNCGVIDNEMHYERMIDKELGDAMKFPISVTDSRQVSEEEEEKEEAAAIDSKFPASPLVTNDNQSSCQPGNRIFYSPDNNSVVSNQLDAAQMRKTLESARSNYEKLHGVLNNQSGDAGNCCQKSDQTYQPFSCHSNRIEAQQPSPGKEYLPDDQRIVSNYHDDGSSDSARVPDNELVINNRTSQDSVIDNLSSVEAPPERKGTISASPANSCYGNSDALPIAAVANGDGIKGVHFDCRLCRSVLRHAVWRTRQLRACGVAPHNQDVMVHNSTLSKRNTVFVSGLALRAAKLHSSEADQAAFVRLALRRLGCETCVVVGRHFAGYICSHESSKLSVSIGERCVLVFSREQLASDLSRVALSLA